MRGRVGWYYERDVLGEWIGVSRMCYYTNIATREGANMLLY